MALGPKCATEHRRAVVGRDTDRVRTEQKTHVTCTARTVVEGLTGPHAGPLSSSVAFLASSLLYYLWDFPFHQDKEVIFQRTEGLDEEVSFCACSNELQIVCVVATGSVS